jgi:hypothetical protein
VQRLVPFCQKVIHRRASVHSCSTALVSWHPVSRHGRNFIGRYRLSKENEGQIIEDSSGAPPRQRNVLMCCAPGKERQTLGGHRGDRDTSAISAPPWLISGHLVQARDSRHLSKSNRAKKRP